MNTIFVGLHGTGKSTKMVALARKINPEKIYLIAKNPFQRDGRTGKLVFPEDFIRTDESILALDKETERQHSVIIVDDGSKLRRHWKDFEYILENPRQNACDFLMSMHGFGVCPAQLYEYVGIAFCFRTSSDPPQYMQWGLKNQMRWARKYITERGNEHSYYIVNNTQGTVRIQL